MPVPFSKVCCDSNVGVDSNLLQVLNSHSLPQMNRVRVVSCVGLTQLSGSNLWRVLPRDVFD